MSRLSFLSVPLLSVPAAAYYTVQKLREHAYKVGLLTSAPAPVPVISVGNILMGGSGKTPFTLYLARLLQTHGFNPAVVSRGYRGTYRSSFLVVSRGDSEDPEAGPSECGDEPFLMAKRLSRVPVIVARRRIHGVRAAASLFGCNVVILDDGFQHLPLQRSLDIVLISGAEDHMFPLGRLREPPSALRRADVVVLTDGAGMIPETCLSHLAGVPVFRCRHEVVGLITGFSAPSLSPGCLAGKEVTLVSAIANPERFATAATTLGWHVTGHFAYRDHYRLADRQLSRILDHAKQSTVVVTEKDWVKLPEWFTGSGRVMAMRIDVKLEQEEKFLRAIHDGIAA